MADLNMDKYNKVKVLEQKVNPSFYNGDVKMIMDEITLAAELAVNDELLMLDLPEGAIILNATVKSPSLGASGILDMGLKAHLDKDGNTVAEDQDSLVQQADAGGAAILTKSGAGAVAIGTQIGKGGAQIFLKCTELSTAGTGVKIQAFVEYVVA